jgi:hypothetical protein
MHLSYMVALNVNRVTSCSALWRPQHLMELEEDDHIHLCDKESGEGSERSIGEFLVHPLN